MKVTILIRPKGNICPNIINNYKKLHKIYDIRNIFVHTCTDVNTTLTYPLLARNKLFIKHSRQCPCDSLSEGTKWLVYTNAWTPSRWQPVHSVQTPEFYPISTDTWRHKHIETHSGTDTQWDAQTDVRRQSLNVVVCMQSKGYPYIPLCSTLQPKELIAATNDGYSQYWWLQPKVAAIQPIVLATVNSGGYSQ